MELIAALDKYRATWRKPIDLQTAAMHRPSKKSQAYAVGRGVALVILIVTLILAAFTAISFLRHHDADTACCRARSASTGGLTGN